MLVAFSGWWLVSRGGEARTAATALEDDGVRLQSELSAYDLAAAGSTLGRMRQHAARAERLTGDPIWAVAGAVPVLGRDVRAARETSAVLADVTRAARPFESVLTRLDATAGSGKNPKGGLAGTSATRYDVEALGTASEALPDLSMAVTAGYSRMSGIDPDGLRPELADGVRSVQQLLRSARGPLTSAAPAMKSLPTMLGSEGKRRWLILLQQNAEARGTGGLVGAYAELTTDRGQVRLVSARSRGLLDRGPKVPVDSVPQELRNHWGEQLTSWTGVNTSPNFPWTGRLAAAGWHADPGRGRLDYVAAVDAHVVAAMLAATGPVTVRGAEINSENAVDFLSRDVYAKWEDPEEVDAVTAQLVQKVFGRFAGGRLDLRSLIKAVARPVEERRMLVWSADPQQQREIERLPIGGVLPDAPGAYAMAVVNNGGGNKMDAYLKVSMAYRPGDCLDGNRVSHLGIDLKNTAPRSGLPDYVTVRSDLISRGRGYVPYVKGSNRVILDVYGPVGSRAGLVTVAGDSVNPDIGFDRGHSVWRIAVLLDPGEQKRVNVLFSAPASDDEAGTHPVVMTQPMVIPPTIRTEPSTPCRRVR